jgi:hypothetical protein
VRYEEMTKKKDNRNNFNNSKSKTWQSEKITLTERDGSSARRLAWPGEIVITLEPFGTDHQATWFTVKGIAKRLQERCHDLPRNLSYVLGGMVKDGYLEKALKPAQLNGKQQVRNDFIYRRTSKPYREKPDHVSKRGFQIYLDHGRLPKWFRDMMQ